MENPSLSRRPDIASKKRYNGGSATSSKAIYDDVFGGPPNFGAPALSPRAEDYSEIFGGFRTPRATSIPVLDLPMVDDEEDEVFFDVRSSGFDYAEVFGGFSGRDFAVSFEDLVMGQSNGLGDSSDEAWTPEADYLSEESEHSIQDKRFSNEDSCESIDGCTEFNISYNKSGEKLNEDLSIGTRHTTRLHDVSGYTFMVDKVTSLPNLDYLYSRDYNDHLNINYSREIADTRHLKKVMSQPAKGGNAVPGMDFVRNDSTFLTISDVSLKTRPSDLPPPSRPPPALNTGKGYSDKTASSCRSVSDGSGSDSSPPFFIVEVDASSSAATMKNSMGKAQEKLKKVKDSMERNSDRRDNKEKAAKLVDGSRSIKGAEEGLSSMQGGVDHGIEFSDMEKHKLKKRQINSDSLEGTYRLNMENSYAEENEGSESVSSQGSDYIDVAGEWKEATQFFELVTNKSKKIFDQDINKTALEQCYEHQKKETAATAEGLQGHPEMMSFMPNRASEFERSYESSGVENRQKVLDKRVQVTEKACRGEPNEKKFSIELQPEETEKRRVRAYDLQGHSDSVKVIEKASRQNVKHKDKGSQWIEDNRSLGNAKKFPYGNEDSNKRSGNALELEENEKKLNVAENEMRLKRVVQQEEKEKMEKYVFEQEENGKTLRESVELKESERKQKEALEKKENERRLKEIFENEERLKREKEENERRLKEILENEERLKREKEKTERKENERRLKEIRENEERLKREKEATERKENERRLKEILENEERLKREIEETERKENERKLKEILENEERLKREKEETERKENERRLKEIRKDEERLKREKEATEREDNEKREKEIIEREENEKRLKQALEKEEMQRRQREASELEKAKRAQNEMRLKALEKEENKTGQAAAHQQKNEKKQEAFGTEEYAKQQLEGSEVRCKEANEKEGIAEKVKEAKACESNPGERMEEVCQKPTCRYLEEAEEIETELEADEKPEKVASISDAKCGRKESKKKHVDATDKERKMDLKMGEDYIELNQVSGLHNNDINKTAGTCENRSELRAAKEIDADETSRMSTDPRNGEEATTSGTEQKSNDKIKRDFQVNMDTELQGVKILHEGVNLMPKCAVKQSVEAGENAKAAQPAINVRGSNQRATQHVHTSQSTEQKGKKDILQQEDKESERMKRERELELERLRKMEEEREREREREKDRMAVDPTILETRERAYAEVRQRTLNDARDRLEKVCMEAREKSFTDNKASVESRIRAERAAVERATAEARERAFQKAMAESQQSQGAWMSNGSKYQYSSVYSERYGVEGESPQRCKARLERYRRTAERAANALQELNMRDLHAQREQAERNRLAETLDADVKRWSSGKEGNLRALLSTLQYILGPDSGWQPIHLTEVITAAAVKKAYRKATLCVHPDKLQQRGATIQQKYICEKVFDLLKDAWNRFNSEER